MKQQGHFCFASEAMPSYQAVLRPLLSGLVKRGQTERHKLEQLGEKQPTFYYPQGVSRWVERQKGDSHVEIFQQVDCVSTEVNLSTT